MLRITDKDFNITHHMPCHITAIIKGYMWGDKDDWYKKFNDTLDEYTNVKRNLIFDFIFRLKICTWQRRLNTDTEIEDNFYCHVCGEKTLFFAFTGNPKSKRECMCII